MSLRGGRLWTILSLLLIVLITFTGAECEEKEEEYPERYPIAYFEWENVRIPMTICLWLIGASVAKISEFLSFLLIKSEFRMYKKKN
uniref:Serpentine receptor class gamma n=1 Tax=Caenorhabditis japonica TaxID=281687 RepID=A0A8R1EMY4_CAEJA